MAAMAACAAAVDVLPAVASWAGALTGARALSNEARWCRATCLIATAKQREE